MKRTVIIQSLLGLCFFVGGLIAQQPTVEVEKVADNVYLYSHNAHRSLFVVTQPGWNDHRAFHDFSPFR